METSPKSKGAQHIETLMQQLPPESDRYQILASARQFKSSWVELGEWLARVNTNSRFSEWGYASFEDYCSKEIRIRRQTAEKLLLAFRFLERKEPGLLERCGSRPLPDYRSVDLLRQADEQEHFSMAEYSELRQAVIDEERSHPAVARRFREVALAQQPEQRLANSYRNALGAARRLATSLKELPEVADQRVAAVEQLIAELEAKCADGRGPENSGSL